MHNYSQKILKFFSLIVFIFYSHSVSADVLPSLMKKPKILILYSYNDTTPWQKRFKEGFHNYLSSGKDKVSIYEEYLDSTRFHDKQTLSAFAKYLSTKYTNIHLDLILTESGAASEFLKYRPTLLSNTPRLFINPSPKVIQQLQQNGQENFFSVKGNLPEALDHIIRTFSPKKVIIVGETKTKISKELVHNLQAHQKHLQASIPIEYFLDLPMSTLLKKVSKLPPETIILYTLIFQDGTGKKYIPIESAKHIAQSASVPVFSHWDTLMGSGIAGGYMLSGREVGKAAAKDALRHLLKTGGTKTTKEDTILKEIYDWQILKRFNMPLEKISKDALFLHKDRTLWETYRWQMIGFLTLLLIMVLWVVILKQQVLERTKELKREKEMAEKTSVTDHLTGLPNRLAIESLLIQEMNQHHQNAEPVCLLMLDMDHFKQINDRYGHRIGDEVLKCFSRTLKPLMHAADHFARWGGEEFMVLVPMTVLDDAIAFAEILRKTVEELRCPELPAFTISIGVAQYQAGQTFKAWYEQADEALYQAKRKGRNCVSS